MDFILGATYIDRHGYNINNRQQTFGLIDRTTVPIRRRAAGLPKPFRSDKPTQVALRGRPKEDLVGVAQSIVLPPAIETNVQVVSETTGTVLLEPVAKLYNKRQIYISSGISYIPKNVPYPIRVANFSTKERRLTKNQVLWFETRAPYSTVTIVMPGTGRWRSCTGAKHSRYPTEPPPDEGGEGLRSSFKPPLEPPPGVSIRPVFDEPDTERC